VSDGTEEKAARKNHVHPFHHAQSHDHASSGDGTALIPATLQVTGTADIESYATVGNGSALQASRTLIIDRDHSVTGVGYQLQVIGVITATAGTSDLALATMGGSNAGITINSGGAHSVVSTLRLLEPNVTETSGSATNAVTLLIANAPTEGTNNYALLVEAGATRLDGELEFGNGVAVVAGNYSVQRDADGTNQLHLNVPTGAKFEFSVNDVAQMLMGASTLTGNVVGTGASQVSAGNHTHSGFAQIDVGTYTGDGATSQAITGVGFTPKYVRIWERETSGAVVVYETTTTIIDDDAQGAAVLISTLNVNSSAIIALGSDGFTVDDNGSDAHPNKNSQVYNYLAIG